jgi:glycosyltransferase involved in cell wall biosynthesis
VSQAPSLQGLRAAIVLGAPEVGGAEKQALLLGRHLEQREGLHVEVWALQPGSGSLREPLGQAGLRGRELAYTIPAHFAGRAALVANLAQQLRRAKIDILLPFTTFPNLLTGLAFRLSGARACIWNERVADPTLVATKSHRLAASLCTAFIANSRAGAELCTTLYGAPPGRVHVVRNGLALAPALEGRAPTRARLGVTDETMVVTMVANVHDRKDHATVLRGFALATAHHHPGQSLLVCAGDAVEDAQRKLESLAAELGIAERVRFPGRVADVAGLLEASDISIFASHAEGTPNGVLESMAKSLPVIASDLPGIRDALGEASARWLVPSRDAEGFAARLRLLLADPALRASVGAENKAIVDRDFSAEQMGARTTAVIREALQRGPGLHLPRLPTLHRSPSPSSSPSIRSHRS